MTTRRKALPLIAAGCLACFLNDGAMPARAADEAPKTGTTLRGRDALGDWKTDAPGVRRLITIDDLAAPFDTSSSNNHPRVVKRPEGAWPKVPEGFKVTEFATGLRNEKNFPSWLIAR